MLPLATTFCRQLRHPGARQIHRIYSRLTPLAASSIASAALRASMSTTAVSQERIFFSTFDVTDQVFLRTDHVIGIVNLKPIVPCHVLLIPPNPQVARLADLPPSSLANFFRAVQLVTSKLEELTGATSSNVAIQDGPDAGQSVPHLHVHILPRKAADFDKNDEIYEHLESFGFDLAGLQARQATKGKARLKPDADEARKARSREEMKAEAVWLETIFDQIDFSV